MDGIRGTPWVTSPGILLRAVRRNRRLSQRDLAANAGVARSVVARIEAGQNMPRLDTFARLLHAANHCLVLVDDHGRWLAHDMEHERLVDRTGSHFPAHLDAVPIEMGEPYWWWGWAHPESGAARGITPAYVQARRRFTPWRGRRFGNPAWAHPVVQDDVT